MTTEEAIYTAERAQGAWVVVRDGHAIVQRFPSGPLGYAAAAQAAEGMNRSQTARQLREQRATNAVRTWRVAHGLSQGQLAAHLGVKTFTLQRWEYGNSEPPLYLSLALERLAQILE